MKKADFIIIGIVLLLALIGWIIFYLISYNDGENGEVYAEIFVLAELFHRVPLRAEDYEILIDNGEGGYNLIRITGDGAYIAEASCRNQICVNAGKHSRPGQIIACLPNRVLVRLTGQPGEDTVDAITY